MTYISEEEKGELIYLVLQNRFASEVLTYREKYYLLKAAMLLLAVDRTAKNYALLVRWWLASLSEWEG